MVSFAQCCMVIPWHLNALVISHTALGVVFSCMSVFRCLGIFLDVTKEQNRSVTIKTTCKLLCMLQLQSSSLQVADTALFMTVAFTWVCSSFVNLTFMVYGRKQTDMHVSCNAVPLVWGSLRQGRRQVGAWGCWSTPKFYGVSMYHKLAS